MAVPTIALYASPPSSLGSSPYSSSVNSHSSHDFDLNSRSTSHASSSPSTSQRQMVGGLSSLFSCRSHHPLKQSSPSTYSVEDSGVLWSGRSDESNFSSSFRHSSLSSSLKRDPSPVSALQGPLSLSGSSGVIGSCRSPPLRTSRERGDSFRVGSPSGSLNGIGVRNSLGSCLDYDSSTFPMYGSTLELDSSSVLADELTFSMEDGFMGTEKGLEPHVKELLAGAQLRHKIFCEESVVKAFYEAEKAHRGQMRASGDPYLQHCVETAVMLALIGVNSSVVAAGLLHDTIDDCSVSYDHIHSLFGADVANLVQGVSELSHLSKLARDSETACKTAEADRLHTVFLAMADARAVLIKLADRLHNMMTLEALPLPKQQRFAKETLEIFAPLANRLGIYKWKVELENLCFKHLNPTECEEISSKLLNSCDEAMITSASEKLEQALKDEGINYCALSGRHKSLYSIYRKMLKKNLTLDEIHDIHGLRLIVEKEDDCFKALNVVHQLWPEVPGKLKDYIHNPKFNGYRSLHTVVLGEELAPLEVQIRTKEMHLQAELGIAAHWRYKEGDRAHSSFVLQMVEWARWILTWQCEEMSKDSASSAGDSDSTRPPCTFPFHSNSCPYSYKPHGELDGPVFVILIENDKMSVREFPANSTMMDVFERAGQGSPRWTQYGFLMKEELRPRLNHKPVVDPSCKLKMGDVIELSPSIPHRSLTGYREEIQRMYEKGLSGSSFSSAANRVLLGGD